MPILKLVYNIAGHFLVIETPDAGATEFLLSVLLKMTEELLLILFFTLPVAVRFLSQILQPFSVQASNTGSR